MTREYPSLYPYSAEEAKRAGEISLWRESYKENIACKDAIEAAVQQNFDGFSLSPDSTKAVLEAFGFKRVWHVLAATIQNKAYDDRFDAGNKAWARAQNVKPDPAHDPYFCVNSHPAVLNGFIHQVRDAYESLQLFSRHQCESMDQDLKGKVLVINPISLKEAYWSQDSQLWLAEGGFGCSPESAGRAVFATCLGDGEQHVRWNRGDFLGVLKEDLIPDWAREQIHKLQTGQEIGPVDPGTTQVMNL